MEKLLKPLVTQVQTLVPQTEQYQQVLNQLADAILRGRQICRPARGAPLTGIYQEIYQQVHQKLAENLAVQLKNYHPQRMEVREWSTLLLKQTFREVLSDDLLKQLALEAQKQPPNSELRRYALRELVEAIRLSGRLARPQKQLASHSVQFYQLIYQEAVNRTLAYVYQKIDNYDPQRGKAQKFMNWVNFRLDKLMIECRRQFNEPLIEDIPSLGELDNLPQPSAMPSRSEQVQEYIQADPDKIFTQEYIRNHPEANFQTIALARFAGTSWKQLSAQLGVPIPTLSRFFQRSCVKFRPYFQEYM